MKLCPKCGNILVPDGKGNLKCRVCSYKPRAEKDLKLKEKIKVHKVKSGRIEKVETYPKTDSECPKCKNKEAYWWIQGTRAADEPETTFYKCTKCGYVWREYL